MNGRGVKGITLKHVNFRKKKSTKKQVAKTRKFRTFRYQKYFLDRK